MTIRDKIKAKFSKNKSSTSTPTAQESPTEVHYTGRTDIEYYKPDEIPKSKYRGRVDKVHQEKLHSYSFEDAFTAMRRPSAALSGTFSPGGTKAFSRRASYVSNLGAQTPARSRRSSLSSDANDSFSIPSSRQTPAELAENVADEVDQTNTGFSTINTFKNTTIGGLPVIKINTEKDNEVSNSHIENSQSSHEMPFTAEELTQAMTRATITPQQTARRTSVFVS